MIMFRKLLLATLASTLVLSMLLPGPPLAAAGRAIVTLIQTSVEIDGLDLHDGTIYQDSGTYYLTGTRYGCGFQWAVAHTPWCGFGYATAPTLTGPWTYQGLYFDPASWQTICGGTGAGCFNPRMEMRPDPGDPVWILYFNAPAMGQPTGSASAYYAMGCNGPAGPCGASAGLPHGSTTQMPMGACARGGGDFTIVTDGGSAWMACTDGSQAISVELLSSWWTGGTGTAITHAGGLTNVESPGMFRLPDGWWVLTYSDPNCGYCPGAATAFAYADRPLGAYATPPNMGAYNTAVRRGWPEISGNTCGAQPRTVATVDGLNYEIADFWYGSPNETNAGVGIFPLVRTAAALSQQPDGRSRPTPFLPFDCR